MFDISTAPSAQQACDAGYTFEAIFPDGTPSGVMLKVVGPESTVARDHAKRRFAELQRREMAARKAGRDAEPASADELDQQMLDLAVVYTIGWHGIADGGQPLPYSVEHARRVYAAHPWLRAQAVTEAQRLGNFVRSSSASCSSTPAPVLPST